MSKKTQKKTQKKSQKKSSEKTDKKTPKNSDATSAAKTSLPVKKSSKAGAAKKAVAKKTPAPAGKAVATRPPKKSAKVVAKSVASRGASTATSAPAAKAKPKPAKAAGTTSGLAEGGVAPAFTLPRDGGSHVSLADYTGQKLVIFFYPRADTPGCTREAIDFTRLSKEFAAAKTAVLGVSADPMKAQESFQKKHALSMPLMSDETHAMLASYGAWGEKSMYGKTFEGVLRTTVLIATDGKIARIWHGVKVDGHADEVLAAARDL